MCANDVGCLSFSVKVKISMKYLLTNPANLKNKF